MINITKKLVNEVRKEQAWALEFLQFLRVEGILGLLSNERIRG